MGAHGAGVRDAWPGHHRDNGVKEMGINMRRIFSRSILFLVVRIVCASTVEAQERVVLDAVPSSVVSSNANATVREPLDAAEQEEFRVRIVERNGQYFWATRDNTEMVYVPPSGLGIVHSFVATSGYVKVLDQSDLPQESILRLQGENIQFLEHVHILLNTITYWGDGVQFDP